MDALNNTNLAKIHQTQAHSGSLNLSLEIAWDVAVARWLAQVIIEVLLVVLTAVIERMTRALDTELACALESEL